MVQSERPLVNSYRSQLFVCRKCVIIRGLCSDSNLIEMQKINRSRSPCQSEQAPNVKDVVVKGIICASEGGGSDVAFGMRNVEDAKDWVVSVKCPIVVGLPATVVVRVGAGIFWHAFELLEQQIELCPIILVFSKFTVRPRQYVLIKRY